ncbi:hypothetical protein Nit79A3_2281 [Nitrosomonas sp. Is79A3]|uniref:hypothetical protein n=1 Tax=Nitrosomonas sp. (strain Is79A3) TaxID=261292 RepID=UPI000215C78D
MIQGKKLSTAIIMCAAFIIDISIAFADTTSTPIGATINSEIQKMQSDTARNPGLVNPNDPTGTNLNNPVAQPNSTSGVNPTSPSGTSSSSPSSVNPSSSSGTGAGAGK